MNTIFGKKIDQSQRFLENGMRIPVTLVAVTPNPVIAVKTMEKDGYQAIQLGYGIQKKANKAATGHSKKANVGETPRFLREVRVADGDMPEIGSAIQLVDVLQPGDVVKVTGISKGKGWAGGVKRYNFKGGPRTHGQSDRERAPGSIGQTTTPGRVYKGKRMAGRMGQDTVSVTNLTVVSVNGDTLYLSGLVPGSKNSLITITKIGEKKKFVPLSAEAAETPGAERPSEPAVAADEQEPPVQAEEPVVKEVAPTVEEQKREETPAEAVSQPAADNQGEGK